jgi:hypothetical protein
MTLSKADASKAQNAMETICTTKIRNILSKTLKGKGKSATLPAASDPALALLTLHVNRLRYMYLSRLGWMKEAEYSVNKFNEAIAILSKSIPEHRRFLEEQLEITEYGIERYGSDFVHSNAWSEKAIEMLKEHPSPTALLSKLQGDLSTFDKLSAALEEVIQRRLPGIDIEFLSPNYGKGHTDKFAWHGYAVALSDAFRSALAGKTEGDCHRFVMAMLPIVTSASPSFENVQLILKKAKAERTVETH